MTSKYLTFKEVELLHDKLQNNRYKCNCGHTIYITNNKDKVLCRWCGKYVYRNKKLEFMERLENARKNNR